MQVRGATLQVDHALMKTIVGVVQIGGASMQMRDVLVQVLDVCGSN